MKQTERMNIYRLIALTALLTFSALTATGKTIIKLTSKKNENRVRNIKFEGKGQQFLLVATKDSLYFVKNILSINDSIIVASNSRDTFEIRSVDIVQIKKRITKAEYIGYVVVGAAALGLVIGVPVVWIDEGKEAAGQQFIGTLAVGSLAIPLIGIGRLTSKYNMNKWKMVSFSVK